MIARERFEEEVYTLLFPAGAIPLDRKPVLGALDARIAEIHSLATGKGPAPKMRRIIDPAESAELTRRIVELRDGLNSLSWKDITRELGNHISADAVRCRYDDAKALQKKDELVGAPPALQDAKPELSEKHAIQEEKLDENKETDINCRVVPDGKHDGEKKEINSGNHIVEPAEMASQDTKPSQCNPIVDLTKTGKYGRFEVPVSSEIDAEIHRMYSEGTPTVGISNALAKKGILISWQRVRSVLAIAARMKSKNAREEARKAEEVALRSAAKEADFGPLSDQARKTSPSQSPPGVEGTPLAERVSPRGTPEEAKPEPKSISRVERDLKIWDLHKAGKTPEAISDLIYAEGLYYDAKAVRRILLQQGAKL